MKLSIDLFTLYACLFFSVSELFGDTDILPMKFLENFWSMKFFFSEACLPLNADFGSGLKVNNAGRSPFFTDILSFKSYFSGAAKIVSDSFCPYFFKLNASIKAYLALSKSG